jgi:hypothetical protein
MDKLLYGFDKAVKNSKINDEAIQMFHNGVVRF